MTETTRAGLRALLESKYAAFRERLRRRYGSEDFADEVMQETWLRLENGSDLGMVKSPLSYLFRIAVNVASDRKASESRRLTQIEANAAIHMADEVLDPARIAEARAEFAALERALEELPWRCRAIFISARVEDVAHDEIARRFRISTRMVEKELRHALDHCAERLDRKVVRRFGPGR